MPTAMSRPPDSSTAYRQRVEDLLTALGSDERRGLAVEEAQSRLERYGRNELTAEKPPPAWRRFLAQFQDVLVILLLIATAISAGLWVFERDAALPYEAIAIIAVDSATTTGLKILTFRSEGVSERCRASRAISRHNVSSRRTRRSTTHSTFSGIC